MQFFMFQCILIARPNVKTTFHAKRRGFDKKDGVDFEPPTKNMEKKRAIFLTYFMITFDYPHFWIIFGTEYLN